MQAAAVAALRPAPGDRLVPVGEAAYASAPARIRTLVGSCVAVTWWHPALHVGYLVHVAGARNRTAGRDLERPAGWFADDAVPRAARWTGLLDPEPDRWHVKVFGGGRQFVVRPGRDSPFDVPGGNLAEVRRQLVAHGFDPVSWHVGGTGPRVVVLDLRDGAAWLSHASRPALGDGDPPLRTGRRPAGQHTL